MINLSAFPEFGRRDVRAIQGRRNGFVGDVHSRTGQFRLIRLFLFDQFSGCIVYCVVCDPLVTIEKKSTILNLNKQNECWSFLGADEIDALLRTATVAERQLICLKI